MSPAAATPAAVGWSSELLALTRRNAQHMSSLEGLESSTAYKEWRWVGGAECTEGGLDTCTAAWAGCPGGEMHQIYRSTLRLGSPVGGLPWLQCRCLLPWWAGSHDQQQLGLGVIVPLSRPIIRTMA